ncbi:hypothetical protein HZY83_01145 [Gemella sp. GH3]|uniref:hypothetical protein n=1 Tax=unclassified Gemella TaxID=2624949 RepID=UPI0015D0A1A1|nr:MULTISPECIES: hypothetical protein [unclassified Gemella]MBF0713315.1 hypothetical protein [Gemella sp. GH3.1]NYS50267.1 hypothetical protein [Gemella sp. GH3]
MNKKTKFLLFAVAGAIVVKKLMNKNERYSAAELERINDYKNYLEDKNFVVVDKKDFDKLNNKKFFKLSSIPKYYGVARTVAKFIL